MSSHRTETLTKTQINSLTADLFQMMADEVRTKSIEEFRAYVAKRLLKDIGTATTAPVAWLTEEHGQISEEWRAGFRAAAMLIGDPDFEI